MIILKPSYYFLLASLMLISTSSYAQVVTTWLTTGDQSTLLEPQTTQPFIPYDGGGTTIVVDTITEYQVIDGFGFCLTQGSAEAINSLSAISKEQLLNELFSENGLNISMLRISIGASDLSNSTYTYNESADDVDMLDFDLSGPDTEHLIPLLQEILAIAPSIKILATPWTAPTWMKTNGTWIGGSLNPIYYTAYSHYFVRYLEEMDALGINIWGITPQNEPENPYNEPSMLMNSTQQTNFINDHLGPALEASGFNPKIIAFDHNCDNTAYPIDVLNNSPYVDGAAFHMYAGDISALSEVRNSTGKNVYFTEQYTDVNGDFNGDLGWHMENVVTGSLNNWSKCVIEWNLATDATYGPHTPGGCTECLGALTINNSSEYDINVSYFIIGHLSKFVRPEAKRISVTTNSPALLVTGFKNPDNSLAILAYNFYGGVDDTQDIQLVVGSQKVDVSVPPRSVVTLVTSESAPVGIDQFEILNDKEIIQTLDCLGRQTEIVPNTPLIHLYNDGTIERVYIMK